MTQTAFDCDECEDSAVGLLKVNGETRYLCRMHYRNGIREYAKAIDTNRLLPTGEFNE